MKALASNFSTASAGAESALAASAAAEEAEEAEYAKHFGLEAEVFRLQRLRDEAEVQVAPLPSERAHKRAELAEIDAQIERARRAVAASRAGVSEDSASHVENKSTSRSGTSLPRAVHRSAGSGDRQPMLPFIRSAQQRLQERNADAQHCISVWTEMQAMAGERPLVPPVLGLGAGGCIRYRSGSGEAEYSKDHLRKHLDRAKAKSAAP